MSAGSELLLRNVFWKAFLDDLACVETIVVGDYF